MSSQDSARGLVDEEEAPVANAATRWPPVFCCLAIASSPLAGKTDTNPTEACFLSLYTTSNHRRFLARGGAARRHETVVRRSIRWLLKFAVGLLSSEPVSATFNSKDRIPQRF